MKTTKLVVYGRDQAVRLPREFSLRGQRGADPSLRPRCDPWSQRPWISTPGSRRSTVSTSPSCPKGAISPGHGPRRSFLSCLRFDPAPCTPDPGSDQAVTTPCPVKEPFPPRAALPMAHFATTARTPPPTRCRKPVPTASTRSTAPRCRGRLVAVRDAGATCSAVDHLLPIQELPST
jgi:hypothetical protein